MNLEMIYGGEEIKGERMNLVMTCGDQMTSSLIIVIYIYIEIKIIIYMKFTYINISFN